MSTLHEPRPYMDKAVPEAWEAASTFATAVSEAASQRGLTPAESELVKVRASQLNGCVFCLDLHSRQARRRLARVDSVQRSRASLARDR